jgi:23S rRNA (pseudouridine1915-N3)-methyltransferase
MVARALQRSRSQGQIVQRRAAVHIRLIAVSDRQPGWVGDAFDEYAKRLPGHWRFQLDVVPTARRAGSKPAGKSVEIEGVRVLHQLKSSEQLVLLDETGTEWTSAQLAGQLKEWQKLGSDLAFVIGGPDGVSTECAQRANHCLSLSRLTLPHGLARVLLVEQLYRAWTLLEGHPYHRG